VTSRPDLQLIAPGASPVEIAAIVGALEMGRPSAPPAAARQDPPSAWLRAALAEGVDRAPAALVEGVDRAEAGGRAGDEPRRG
jgi:hypothetical protein